MRPRLIAFIAFFILIATFVVDVFTPQTLVIAIILDIPIVLAALTQSRGLTAVLVVLSVGADVAAGWINAYREGQWSSIGIIDRALTLLSIVLVGILCTTLQERAKHVAGLAVRASRARREATLASAGKRIRETLSSALVARALVREALPLLEARAVRWYPYGSGEVLAAPLVQGVGLIDEAISPEIASVIQKATDEGSVLAFTGSDAVARLLLDRLQARAVLAVPVRNRSETFGVLLISGDQLFDEEVLATAWAYAELAETALVQARLFDELARRNEELAERQEVIRDLVYALSHDLRTPLAALSVTLQQARDGAYGALPGDYCDVVSASLVSIDDLRRLAETLLLVARIEAGEHQSRPEPVPIRALAQDVLAEFEAMAQARDITLRVKGVELYVMADRADLRRAVVNLVANALQYTALHGTVSLCCLRVSNAIHLEVEDDGFGVADEQVPYLFQRFSGGRAGGGSGLGLYIVRRIAEQNGGSVSYRARQPRGSLFTLELIEALHHP